MRKNIIILCCLATISATASAQEKKSEQGRVIAPLANVSAPGTPEVTINAKATLTPAADITVAPAVVPRLTPERVTGPTRHDATINYGKPVPPKWEDEKETKKPTKK